MDDLLKPADDARVAGVSYPTLKQWIFYTLIKATEVMVISG